MDNTTTSEYLISTQATAATTTTSPIEEQTTYSYLNSYQSYYDNNNNNTAKMNSIDSFNNQNYYQYYSTQNYSYYQPQSFDNQEQNYHQYTNNTISNNNYVEQNNNSIINYNNSNTTSTTNESIDTNYGTNQITASIANNQDLISLINTCQMCNKSFPGYHYSDTCDSCKDLLKRTKNVSLESSTSSCSSTAYNNKKQIINDDKLKLTIKKSKKLKKHKYYPTLDPNDLLINNTTQQTQFKLLLHQNSPKYNEYKQNYAKSTEILKQKYKMMLHAIKLAITRKRDSIKDIYLSTNEISFDIIQDLIKQHLFELTKSIIINIFKIFYDQENFTLDDLKPLNTQTNLNKLILISYLYLIENIDNFDSLIHVNTTNANINDNYLNYQDYFKHKLFTIYSQIDLSKLFCNIQELKMIHFTLILLNYFLYDLESDNININDNTTTCVRLLTIIFNQLCHDKLLKTRILLSLSEL